MLRLKLGSFELLVEGGFAGISVGRRNLYWSRVDGLRMERVPGGYTLGF